jgi:O-antigen ligase
MSKVILEKKYSNFVIVLLLLFPIAINSVKIFGNLILLILVILGVYIAISEKKNPFQVPELKLFSWLVVGYFSVILLSILIADGVNAEFHHLGRKLHFLLAPFIALTLLQINLPLKKLLLSIKLGLIVVVTLAIVGPLLGNSNSMINANIFSDIVVAMIFLSIVQIFSETPKERTITFIAVLAGSYVIFLIGTRGSWMSFLILSLVFFSLIYKPFLQGSNKAKLFLVLLFVGLLGFISTNDRVESRVKLAVSEIQNWNSGHNANDSVGLRLQMWKAGLEAAAQSPWTGYGYRNANKVTSEYASENKKTIRNKTHLHNEYLTNLVSMGIIGLLSLLILLFTPMVVFYRKLKNKDTYHYSVMGILLCVGYATFGFTHIAFGEEHINAFYILFMGFLLPRVMKNN